jgi:hypothetical protein
MELYLHSPHVFMVWYLVRYRDNFTFTFTAPLHEEVWRVEIKLQSFLSLALNGSGQLHTLASLPLEKQLLVPPRQEAGWPL